MRIYLLRVADPCYDGRLNLARAFQTLEGAQSAAEYDHYEHNDKKFEWEKLPASGEIGPAWRTGEKDKYGNLTAGYHILSLSLED